MMGIMHWLFVIYEFSYPFVFKNYLFDNIYVLIIVAKIISWIALKDECIISLLIKQQINKNYKAGDDAFSLDDMVTVSPFLTNILLMLYPVLAIFQLYLFFIVSRRNNLLDKNSLTAFITIFIIYMLYTRKFYNESLYKKLQIDAYASYFKFLFVIILLYILYILLKNVL